MACRRAGRGPCAIRFEGITSPRASQRALRENSRARAVLVGSGSCARCWGSGDACGGVGSAAPLCATTKKGSRACAAATSATRTTLTSDQRPHLASHARDAQMGCTAPPGAAGGVVPARIVPPSAPPPSGPPHGPAYARSSVPCDGGAGGSDVSRGVKRGSLRHGERTRAVTVAPRRARPKRARRRRRCRRAATRARRAPAPTPRPR